MLKSNSIRFLTDTFGEAVQFIDDEVTPQPVDPDTPDTPGQPTFYKTALLVSKVALNCENKSYVDQFVITGNEPTGTSRRMVFIIDDATYIIKNNALVAWNRDLTFENVISYGNRISVLTEQSNLDCLVGKKIYPVIALKAPYDADEFPTIKIALATRVSNDQLVNTVESPVYQLADSPETILEITDKTNLIGNAAVEVTVRLRNNGSWSSYMTFADAVDQLADAVQFKMRYSVTNPDGSESAQVQSITVKHTSGTTIVTGNNANLFSTVQSYEVDLQSAYVVVHHAPLIDAAIEAYVNFLPEPKRRDLLEIGIGTGARQELTLGSPDANIVPDSILLYVDGEPFYDFDFSTSLSTVILTAKKNAVITASYDYDYGDEVWLKMTAEEPQPYNDEIGSYSTRFTYSLPNDVTGMRIANVRIRLRRLSGSASETLTKAATGKTQLFSLKHQPKPTTITFTQPVTWSFNENAQLLSCVAAKGTTIALDYDWQGDAPIVYSFAAGYSVA